MSAFFTGETILKSFPKFVFLFVFMACFSLPRFTYPQEDSTLNNDSATIAVPDSIAGTAQSVNDSVMQTATDSTLHAADSTSSGENGGALAAGHSEGVSDGHEIDAVKRGKRFFLGILPFEREYEACVSCHNLKPVDTLNWYPSAYEIALKYAGKDFAAFQQAVMNPSGKLLTATHQNFEIPTEDLETVKTYLDDLAIAGPPTPKPSISRILLFLFLGLLITWALLDLIVFHKVKYKIIPVIIFLGAFGYQVVMIYVEAAGLGRSENYQPEQPVKFSHEVHVTQNQIDCMYCHHTATHSKSANIPSTNLCMNCHLVVREGSRSGKFEINKVVEAFEEGRSIEWIRIHKLPDHVFFSHAQHVGVGKLDCQKCHGEVQEMHVVRQVSDLGMGWCLECHRETKVDFMDNDFYKTYEKFHEEIKAGIRDSVTAAEIGANNCQKCHY